jgi:hypothetical protein
MAHALSRIRAVAVTSPRYERACRGLVLTSAAALFLHDAGTVGVSYTLRISYALIALACVLGIRFVLEGWRLAPDGVKLAAGFLIAVYAVAGLLGQNPVLTSQARGSSARWVVYILDLGLGLASVGLLLRLFRDWKSIRQLLLALAVGTLLGATYGVYQWVAQRYGLPLSNLDNAPNSNGFTVGALFQGRGLLGWERFHQQDSGSLSPAPLTLTGFSTRAESNQAISPTCLPKSESPWIRWVRSLTLVAVVAA